MRIKNFTPIGNFLFRQNEIKAKLDRTFATNCLKIPIKEDKKRKSQ